MENYEGFELLGHYNGHDWIALFCKICRQNQDTTQPLYVFTENSGQVDVVTVLEHIDAHLSQKLETHRTA